MFFEATSPSMRGVEALTRELAQTDVPVLLLGEQGSGKVTTAERIHQLSPRRGEPFRSVRCAVLIAEQLVAGADQFFRSGTLFLQEITELSPACQKLLLEALPQAGNNAHQTTRSRLIFGSAQDLELEVKSGRLREDLYYRISGVSLHLPPLRQRREDISPLVSFYLAKCGAEFQRPAPVLSEQTLSILQDYSWPGNIRELEYVARAIVVLGDESVAMGGLRSMLTKPERAANGQHVSLKQAARAASREAEKNLILKVLARTRWNRRRAAQELQISYKALLYKLKQINCEQEAV